MVQNFENLDNDQEKLAPTPGQEFEKDLEESMDFEQSAGSLAHPEKQMGWVDQGWQDAVDWWEGVDRADVSDEMKVKLEDVNDKDLENRLKDIEIYGNQELVKELSLASGLPMSTVLNLMEDSYSKEFANSSYVKFFRGIKTGQDFTNYDDYLKVKNDLVNGSVEFRSGMRSAMQEIVKAKEEAGYQQTQLSVSVGDVSTVPLKNILSEAELPNEYYPNIRDDDKYAEKVGNNLDSQVFMYIRGVTDEMSQDYAGFQSKTSAQGMAELD